MQANTLEVKGHGHIHAVHINLTANTMVVDDLGLVIGDRHDISCVQGDGVTSASGASGNKTLLFCLIDCIWRVNSTVHC